MNTSSNPLITSAQADFHRELAIHIIRYIARLASAGTGCKQPLLDFGVSIEEQNRLSQLTIPEVDKLAELSIHFLNTAQVINTEKISQLLTYIETQRRHEDTVNRLLRLQAPLPLMNHLYAMDREDYIRRCKQLGLKNRGGRPRNLTEEEEDQVTTLWMAKRTEEIPIRLIAIGDAVKAPLSAVFYFLCEHYSKDFNQTA